jgi:hypothetical protein
VCEQQGDDEATGGAIRATLDAMNGHWGVSGADQVGRDGRGIPGDLGGEQPGC